MTIKLPFYHPAWLIATGLGIGKIPFMPGTFGSILGLLFSQPLFIFALDFSTELHRQEPQYSIWLVFWAIISTGICSLFFLGWWASAVYQKRTPNEDPKEVVIDEVVGMICVNKEDSSRTVLVVSEKGFGKRTAIDEYRITNRGGKGVKTINVTEKTGRLVDILYVTEKEDLIITCKSGITIRTGIADIREAGRATQGVKLIRLDEGDEIAAISQIEDQEEEIVETVTDELNEIVTDETIENKPDFDQTNNLDTDTQTTENQ